MPLETTVRMIESSRLAVRRAGGNIWNDSPLGIAPYQQSQSLFSWEIIVSLGRSSYESGVQPSWLLCRSSKQLREGNESSDRGSGHPDAWRADFSRHEGSVAIALTSDLFRWSDKVLLHCRVSICSEV